TEARVIRDIFTACAAGRGYRDIAATLNASGIATPRGAKAWSSSSVRALLHNEIYRGVCVWNKSRKRDDWGSIAPHDRPKSEWLRAPAPTRIVSEDVWRRAHAQLDQRRRSYLAATKGE